MKFENISPKDIEKKSFSIIRDELEERGISLPAENEKVIMRAIHATADFDYADTLTFSEDAVSKAKDLIRSGADIITDTNMAVAGINKRVPEKFGGKVRCFMADEDVAQEASRRKVTRAAVSMERAAELGENLLFAIGNAPTALKALYELYEGGYRPGVVIGVPVGFVNVCAAKELIMNTDMDHIVNRGRKGGSNVCAAIVNAILYDI